MGSIRLVPTRPLCQRPGDVFRGRERARQDDKDSLLLLEIKGETPRRHVLSKDRRAQSGRTLVPAWARAPSAQGAHLLTGKRCVEEGGLRGLGCVCFPCLPALVPSSDLPAIRDCSALSAPLLPLKAVSIPVSMPPAHTHAHTPLPEIITDTQASPVPPLCRFSLFPCWDAFQIIHKL